MKIQSNIPIPEIQLWKDGQWIIAINPIDNGVQVEGDEGKRYEADFTIVDALTEEATAFALKRMTQDKELDDAVTYNLEVDGKPAIEIKPDYEK